MKKASSTLRMGRVDNAKLVHQAGHRVMPQFQPFGQANPEPVIGTRHIELAQPPQLIGEGGRHFRFYHFNTNGERVSGIAWNLGASAPPANTALDMAFKLSWNHWNDSTYPQMEIIDWRLSE